MHFFILIFLFFCFFSPNINAQESTPNTDISKRLATVFQKNQLVGMSVIVIKDNKIAFEGYFGKADIARGIKVSEHTQYRVASISKAITAVALMQLYEKGLFKLEDDISNYLGYRVRNPYFPAVPITFKMLLSHTSTIADWAVWDRFVGLTFSAFPPSFEVLFDSTSKYYNKDIFLDKQPATYFAYCNLTYGIIASLIEILSKERFDVYCNEHIFKPLGMKSSFNPNDLPNLNHLAVLYRKEGKKWKPQTDNFGGIKQKFPKTNDYKLGKNGLLLSPQGGLRASALDLYKFSMALMNGGTFEQRRILQDTTVALMQKAAWNNDGTNSDGKDKIMQSWGLGLHLITNKDSADVIFPPMKMAGHPGDAYGLVSDMYFDAKGKNGIIFITNGSALPMKVGTKTAFFRPEEAVFEVVYEIFFKKD